MSAPAAVSVAAASLLALLAAPLPAAGPPSATVHPDFTRGDPVPEGATHDWNLGPTGAGGWMYSNELETSEARQIYITRVDEGSPADGALRPGDVIVRVDPRYFRPAEVETLLGDPSLAKEKLGWVPTTTLDQMVDEMVDHDLDQAMRVRILRERGFDVSLDQE